MFEQFRHRGWHHLTLLAAGVMLFLVNLGGATLWDLDEGKNSECSREMLASRNYIVPTFNSELRVDKPALLYWLQVAAYQAFGVNEFAARLPSALAALLTMLLCYELGRTMFGATTGLLAGLMVGSTPMLCGAARFANPDALLNLFVVLTMLLFWQGQDRPGRWWYAALGVSTGLAMLAKGPVGLVLPAMIAGVYCLGTGQVRLLLRRDVLLMLTVFLLVAAPWYAWVAAETKAKFIEGFLLNHNVGRFLEPMENHRGSPFYYVIVLLLGTAPWSIFAGLMFWYGIRSVFREPWHNAREESQTRACGLLLTWIGVFVVFFSLAATKLPNYILPVSVPFALLTARFLVRWSRREIQPAPWILGVSVSLLMLIGVGTSAGLLIAGGTWPMPFRTPILPGLEKGAIFGVIPLLGGLLAWRFLRQENRRGLVWTVTLTTLAFIGPLAAWANAALNPFKAPLPLVEQAGTLRTDEIRIGCWQMQHLPSLNFYCRRDVLHFASDKEIQPFLRWPIRVYVFLPASEWANLQGRLTTSCREVGRHRDLYRNAEVVVVTNR